MIGAIVSSVITVGVDGNDVLIPSNAVAVNELSPSDSGTEVNCQTPPVAVCVPRDVAPLNSSTVESASPVPSTVIGDDPTIPAGVVITGTAIGEVCDKILSTFSL